MVIALDLAVIITSSIAIYLAGKRFAKSSSAIGDYLRLPRDVKGATFDAISSSLPELLVALYSVIIFKQFEVGIGTIAGSALFNLLIIPGICVFLAPIAFKVSWNVISRDALYYLIATFTLAVLLIYSKTWGIIIALLLISIYLLYIRDIAKHTKRHREANQHQKKEESSIKKEVTLFFTLMAVIGAFTFLLTDASISLARELGVPAVIIAFTIIAAATSVPDAVISLVNAKKGDIDDATSNVFGSNTFDILIGIGLPLLIYTIIKGPVTMTFTNTEVVLGLMGATILVLYFFAEDHQLSKKQATILLALYLAFLAYVIRIAIT